MYRCNTPYWTAILAIAFLATRVPAAEPPVNTHRMACIQNAMRTCWHNASPPSPEDRLLQFNLNPDGTLQPNFLEMIYIPGGSLTAPNGRSVDVPPL